MPFNIENFNFYQAVVDDVQMHGNHLFHYLSISRLHTLYLLFSLKFETLNTLHYCDIRTFL